MRKNTTILVVSLLVAGGAQAATITWATSDIFDLNDVITTGLTVEAVNASGTGGNSVVTVAGIDFVENNVLGVGNNNGDFFALDTGDAGYNEFLGDLDFDTGSAATAETYTFTGLDLNQDYVVQFWYADDGGFNAGRTMTLTGTGDNVLQGNDYAVGTFTADAVSQDLTWSSSAQGIRVTGFQLRTVPEPSSMALLSLGVLALGLRRKR